MDILQYGKAICYSGYRKGQNPKGDVPTTEQIAEDLELLAADGYRYLRMYDPNLHARRVLEVIRDKKMPIKCLIGIDSDPESNNERCPFEKQNYSEEELRQNAKRNDAEVEKLIALVKEFPDEVIAVSVGNENTPFWGAHMVSQERLIAHAKRLKAALNKPVTFCEGYFEWPHIKELAKEVDFISVHSYPYHYGDDVADAVEVNKKHYADMKAMFPDKQVVFTELGWSSDNTTPNYYSLVGEEMREVIPEPGTPMRASVENERRYVEEVEAWLEQEKIIAFIFEAFDELWKGPKPNSSECNFGLYREDRKKKW